MIAFQKLCITCSAWWTRVLHLMYIVDTEILLEKLKLYGFDQDAIQWTWSYLTHRSQGVYIDGAMSSLLALEAGVPQGSMDQYTTPFSPMSSLRLFMRMTALSLMIQMPASSVSSVMNVEGSAVMQMIVPLQSGVMIQKSCQRHLARSIK